MTTSNSTEKDAETEKKERMTRAQITAAAAEKMGRVYQAVRDLHAVGRAATRETVAEMCRMPLIVVDEQLRALHKAGQVTRVLRGHYEPALVFDPPRPISKTVLSDGSAKIEVGDEVLLLTPAEDRALGQVMVGSAGVAVLAESSRQHIALATSLMSRQDQQERVLQSLMTTLPSLLDKAAAFDSLRKEVSLVRRKIIDITPQPQLFPAGD